jgi:hypothetical protein
MTGLNPLYFTTSDLDTFYVDNGSGLPLAGGIVTFYSDVNRTTLKPVYQLTPGLTYVALPNPSVLSMAGTFQDALGNNIVPYYYPWTGTDAHETGVQELYYITVQSADFVQQFTRQAWPNAAVNGTSPVSNNTEANFIPNGQFLAHNDIVSATEPPVTTYAFGTTTIDSQAIAQGGWTFQHTTGGTSVFNNSFQRLATGIAGLNDFPRYAFNFSCTSFNASDTIRDLSIQWRNVNTFSSGNPPGSQPYTFYFSAASNDSNTHTFTVYVTYYFGTGGAPSSPTQVAIGTVNITPGYSSYTVSIPSFVANAGTIGSNDDDYIGISLRGSATTWDAQFTDFALLEGVVTLTSFPVQTESEALYRGVAGWMPVPAANGNDLYLPLVLTPTGMIFDHSQVGTIIGAMRTAINNELLCDGAQYQTSSYSTLGIPYSRLQSVLFDSVSGLPIFGTGANYVNTYVSGSSNNILLVSQNKQGAQTAPADGAAPTSFTFNGTVNATTAGYEYQVWSNSNGSVAFKHLPATSISTAAGAGTSGMNVGSFNNPVTTLYHYEFLVLTLPASNFVTGGTGLYFIFNNASTAYYMWFQTGTEVDPAVGGRNGIQCNLDPSMTAADVGIAIQNVMNGFQNNTISVTATPPNNSYFTFHSNGVTYIPWYNVASGGVAPVVSGTLIQVNIAAGATATQVVTATQKAINAMFFAVPDLRGMFLRGTDPNSAWDNSNNHRFGYSGLNNPLLPGSFEFDIFESHLHTASSVSTTTISSNATVSATQVGSKVTSYTAGGTTADTIQNAGSGNQYNTSVPSVGQAGYSTATTTTIAATGNTETRPVNAYVNWFIKF